MLFIEQKNFDWLGKKRLDFYIPSKKMAIECQGLQHFKKINHFGGEKALKERIKRDITKNIECEENNIKIIYIVENKEKINYNNPIYNGIYNNVMTIEEFEKWLLND